MTNPSIHLHPYEELLWLLCLNENSQTYRDRIALLISQGSEWDEFLRLAGEHGIVALISWKIRENELKGFFPDGVNEKLEAAWNINRVRNIWLAHRWKEVNEIFRQAGIKHLLLKGMVIEYTAFRGEGVRQMTDNDILVKREDALKAWNLLISHQFNPELIKSPLHKPLLLEMGKHLPRLEKDGYAIEIHHRLFEAVEANDSLNYFIDNPVKIMVEGEEASALPQKVHSDYLTEHLNYHLMSGETQLRLFADLMHLNTEFLSPYTEEMIRKPFQAKDWHRRRSLWKTQLKRFSCSQKIFYLGGELFPSIEWMAARHRCSKYLTLLYYPRRLGKLFWLL